MKVLTLAEVREQDIAKAYLPTPQGLMFYQRIGSEDGPVHFEVQKKVYSPFSIDDEEGIKEGFNVLNIQNLGKGLLSEIIALFRRVYDDHKSEMIVCFGWDKDEKKYTLERPKCATIGPGYLAYRQEKSNVGTVHSHGGFGASFSSIDDKHEMDQPGIYMVLGGFAQKVPSIVASITAMGKRAHLKVPQLNNIEGLDLELEISDEYYAWWMERTMLLADVKKKVHGWFVLDWKSDIVWWAPFEKDLEDFKEPGLTIVPYTGLEAAQVKVKQTWDTYQYPTAHASKVWTPSEIAAAKKKPYAVTNQEAIGLILSFLQKNELLDLLLSTALEEADHKGLKDLLETLTDAYDGCEMALEDYTTDSDPHFDDPTDPHEDDPATVRSEIEEFYSTEADPALAQNEPEEK